MVIAGSIQLVCVQVLLLFTHGNILALSWHFNNNVIMRECGDSMNDESVKYCWWHQYYFEADMESIQWKYIKL